MPQIGSRFTTSIRTLFPIARSVVNHVTAADVRFEPFGCLY
jgi:hypothetical protein